MISGETYMLLELLLVKGVFLAFCFHQLWTVRRLRREDEAKAQAERAAAEAALQPRPAAAAAQRASVDA